MINKNGDNQQLLLDLFRAYFDTRKNKQSTANALAFGVDYEKKLFVLYRDIMDRKYVVGRSVCFIVDSPVKREIFAADFRDRIVHHLIFNYINPIFEQHFIKDSYSCRLGKGTSEGIRRVDHFIRSGSENYQKDCWILKLDIKGYFMAIDKNILYKKIESKLKTVKNMTIDVDIVLYLIHTVVFHDPTKNFVIKGMRSDWTGLPKSKSLFFTEQGKGFPIGNLTSQLFGNIYLDDFDHFVHEKIGIQLYGRYVDDMVFVDSRREFLKDVIVHVDHYLHEELKLTIHPKKTYVQRIDKGVSFLGTYIKPWRIYIGERTKHHFYDHAQLWNKSARQHHGLDTEEAKNVISGVNSYLGIMKHYDTYNLRRKMAHGFSDDFLRSIIFSKNFEKVAVSDQKSI